MKKELRIGIVGSRRRNTLRDRELVYECIKSAVRNNPNREIVVVSGACKQGADAFAAEACRVLGVRIKEFPVIGEFKSKWEFAKEAFARNRLIAEDSEMGFALCHDDRKGGTEDTVSHYQEFKKPIFLVRADGTIEDLLKK
jgi:predicted Rossmann fold nucleotide-binding protein DprA/Smf involved in DNA uptake